MVSEPALARANQGRSRRHDPGDGQRSKGQDDEKELRRIISGIRRKSQYRRGHADQLEGGVVVQSVRHELRRVGREPQAGAATQQDGSQIDVAGGTMHGRVRCAQRSDELEWAGDDSRDSAGNMQEQPRWVAGQRKRLRGQQQGYRIQEVTRGRERDGGREEPHNGDGRGSQLARHSAVGCRSSTRSTCRRRVYSRPEGAMRMVRRAVWVCAITAGASCALPGTAFAQFGKGMLQSKTDVVLTVRKPPRVVVSGSTIKVEVVARVSDDNLVRRFREAVERQLTANDAAVKVSADNADTLVRCTITRMDVNQTAGSRVVTVTKQTGTKQELNAKTGKMETKPVYGTVPETRYFTTVQGDMRVEVRVRVLKSNALIASRAYMPTFTREYAAGVRPEQEQIENNLIASGARGAAGEVTASRVPVTVLLGRPNGDVDDLNKLAKAGQWSRMAAELERMKPLSDPKKDAYRLFNIGVANEAQAYAADDLGTTKRFLERASAMYARALQIKPDEEYFPPPIARVTDSRALFDEFERQQTLLASGGSLPNLMPAGAAEPAAATTGAAAPATGGAPMTNKDVIDLLRAGLSEENLIAAIKDAKTVKFDLSVAGYKELLAAKLPNTVLTAMRRRQTP